MANRLSNRVRLRNTHITGQISGSFQQDGEMFYWIVWDDDPKSETELYRERELDSADKPLSYPSRRYWSSEWSDRKLQASERELYQAIYPEPPSKGYPCQRR